MRTNIDINEEDVKVVMKYFNVTTKKEAVALALKEVLRLKANQVMLSLEGTGWGWEGDQKKSEKKVSTNAD